jgi:hypothetical protein
VPDGVLSLILLSLYPPVKETLVAIRQKTGWDPKPNLNNDDDHHENKELFIILTG